MSASCANALPEPSAKEDAISLIAKFFTEHPANANESAVAVSTRAIFISPLFIESNRYHAKLGRRQKHIFGKLH
jgi:hypothetical protein